MGKYTIIETVEEDFRHYENKKFHTSYESFKESLKINELRKVTVKYTDGDTVSTSMASHLTDDEIYDYFAPGKKFNVGINGEDLIKTVDHVIIHENVMSRKEMLSAKAKEIKSKYRDFKFSIRTEYNKITVNILSGPIELRETPDQLPGKSYRPHFKTNLSDEAKTILDDIYNIANEGNSIISADTDYGNWPDFYVNVHIGRWDRPYEVK